MEMAADLERYVTEVENLDEIAESSKIVGLWIF